MLLLYEYENIVFLSYLRPIAKYLLFEDFVAILVIKSNISSPYIEANEIKEVINESMLFSELDSSAVFCRKS